MFSIVELGLHHLGRGLGFLLKGRLCGLFISIICMLSLLLAGHSTQFLLKMDYVSISSLSNTIIEIMNVSKFHNPVYSKIILSMDCNACQYRGLNLIIVSSRTSACYWR